MKRNDLDKAEAYAKLSAKQSGLFDYPLWASDNPSQAPLKDIQEARKKAAASVTSPPRTTDNAITQASAKAEPAPQAPPARPPAAAPASPARAPAPVVAQAVLTKDEAVAQLKHGRAQLGAGMLDDAGVSPGGSAGSTSSLGPVRGQSGEAPGRRRQGAAPPSAG